MFSEYITYVTDDKSFFCEQVYRTKDKGWAVRSRDFIPSGAPVCEYSGILRKSDELDNVSENDYIFDIDCLQTMRGIGGREVPIVMHELVCDICTVLLGCIELLKYWKYATCKFFTLLQQLFIALLFTTNFH